MSATPSWGLAPGRSITLARPRLIAILNITPDSFSDGGQFLSPDTALARAVAAMNEGADALDIGGESTRPGAPSVPPDEQITRVVPVIRAIRAAGIDAPITIDTTSARVASAALEAGADAINDVAAGRDDPAMLPLAAERRRGIILMHRLRAPGDDHYSTDYAAPPDYSALGGVVRAVRDFLKSRAAAALAAGVPPESICIDPGLGFGKSVADNRALIRAMPEFVATGYPVLFAASRKSFLARPIGPNGEREPPAQRVESSVTAALEALSAGVRLFRVHDVAAHAAAFLHAVSVRDR